VPVGRDPDGEDLPDPTGGSNYADFSAQPLFTWPGPDSSDIDQNALGDCYFLATIGSMAHTNSDFIARSMVELGDGSYAVRFFRDRRPVYLRVDGDLPTNGSGALVYAGLGANGALWGAIAEKAWAYFRQNDGNYQSAAGGWPDEVYSAFGTTSTSHGRNIFGNWEGGPDALINYILNEWIAGKSVTVCTPSSTPGLLVGDHAYGVESLYWSGTGWRVVLRNPWGGSGAYVDLDAAQLAANIERVDSAFVA
jgi:hypothetical protein